MKKKEIRDFLIEMKKENENYINNLTKTVSVLEYKDLVRKASDGAEIWTDAFQKAFMEYEVILIPKKETPYYIDKTVIIPSDTHIEAEEGAVIRQCENVKVLMFRNENTKDGIHMPFSTEDRNKNISINGGRWEESYRQRMGYGRSGMYDDNNDGFYGVSTCMLFNNIENLTLTNMSFCHTAGFSVQTGDLKNGVFENITFEECYADGLHLNGNTENIFIKNVKGQVGDDLVALNMYDWQNSSVNFGPMKNVMCENLELSEDSPYKAMRIEPGMYYYDDGSSVDCSIENLYVKNVRGINTFKLYYQTFPYKLGTEPEKGAVGSGDNIYFEDIDVDLSTPLDKFYEYMNSDPIKGAFAAFELGMNVGRISFENINLKLYKEKYPMSYFVCIGPKSVLTDGTEIFDPYLSSTAKELNIKNLKVNGKSDWKKEDLIREIEFFDVNSDGKSTAKGKINKINVEFIEAIK